MRVYLAGPLFTVAERQFMADFRDMVNTIPGCESLWPGDLFAADALALMGAQAKEHIFQGCARAIAACTMVIAVLDGAQVDDGTAWEIGYATARAMPIWGLRTDFRVAGDTACSVVNCRIECSCARIFRDVPGLLAQLTVFSRQLGGGATDKTVC